MFIEIDAAWGQVKLVKYSSPLPPPPPRDNCLRCWGHLQKSLYEGFNQFHLGPKKEILEAVLPLDAKAVVAQSKKCSEKGPQGGVDELI